MKSILFILMLIGGLLSFNSYASDCPAGIKLPAGTYDGDYYSFPVPGSGGYDYFVNLDGCEYKATGYTLFDDGFLTSSSFESTGRPAKPGSVSVGSPENKPGSSGDSGSDGSTSTGVGTGLPDGSDNGTGTSGGASDGSLDGSSSGSSTPQPSEPEKPYPADAGAFQLLDSFYSCSSQAYGLPSGTPNNVFNSVARKCNAILESLSSLVVSGEDILFSDDGQKFLTKNGGNSVLSCHKTTDTERQQMIANGYYPSFIPAAVGSVIPAIRYRDGTLDFNYTLDNVSSDYCDATYQTYIASQNKPSDNKPSDFDSSSSFNPYGASSGSAAVSCPVGYHLSDVDGKTCFIVDSDGSVGFITPAECNSASDYFACLQSSSDAANSSAKRLPSYGGGSLPSDKGHADSGDGDNGDVVAAINAFHADANKNHQETMDSFTGLPRETPDLIEGYLSPKLNSIIDGMKKEMTDGYNDALAEFKGVFGDIDSYIPDIKLSFDLPVQFTSGIRGRCVPLVFDFNITLVGFQPYHFHAEGVQACQLYDAYIRSIVEYMLYFLTALACRRVFTRAAEFASSQP
ncbi:hypothetical protein AH865_15130 [Salmonella enterica subsp. enterica serovar Infantis]|nr:hypothetical protein [Salmonella enterica subsp. enterica serovar Infantis]EGI5076496.1 hypothetical protein [Salmonella enterica subsp. enterica serovar Infantis]